MTAISGEREYTVGTAAWKGLGPEVAGQRFTTGRDLVEALGIDWRVSTGPMINARTGQQVGKLREVIKEDGAGRPTLGIVKKRWTPIQNEDAIGFIPELAGPYGLEVVTGGELDRGAKIWVLTKVGEQVFPDRILPNGEPDRIDHHLLFWNSHDAEGSCRIAAIPHAIHCANALAAAWNNAEFKWAIRHTKNAAGRLAEAHRNIGAAIGWLNDFGEHLIALEKERFTVQQMRTFAEDLMTEVEGLLVPKTPEELGLRKNGEPRTDHAMSSRERRVDKLTDLFAGEGASCRGASKLDAYQAVTEFVDHHKARARAGRDTYQRQVARFHDSIFGHRSQQTKEAAFRRLIAS